MSDTGMAGRISERISAIDVSEDLKKGPVTNTVMTATAKTAAIAAGSGITRGRRQDAGLRWKRVELDSARQTRAFAASRFCVPVSAKADEMALNVPSVAEQGVQESRWDSIRSFHGEGISPST